MAESQSGDCSCCETTVDLRKKDGKVKAHRPHGITIGPKCPGSGKKPLPPMRKFIVRGTTDWQVEVEARTADEAGSLIDDFDYNWWDDQELLGYSVDEVVSKENEGNTSFYADEREMCQNDRCGHPVVEHTGRIDWKAERGPDGFLPRIEGACCHGLCECRKARRLEEEDDDA